MMTGEKRRRVRRKVKEVSQRTKEGKTKGRMRIRRKRWRTGLVSTGREDWRRRPIPRVTKTKEEANGRQGISKIAEKQTEGIGYVAEKDDERDDEKTTKRRETERR